MHLDAIWMHMDANAFFIKEKYFQSIGRVKLTTALILKVLSELLAILTFRLKISLF